MRQCIIGNPENRRVGEYCAAASRLGLANPDCISWLDLLSQESAAMEKLSEADLVRIESAGENSEVTRRLIRNGGGNQQLAFGEIGGLREQYVGFAKLLDTLANVDVRYQNRPGDIKTMFDKWLSHERFLNADLPRPRTTLIPENIDLRVFLNSRYGSVGRVFVKPRFASSASGVCAYRWSNDRQQLIAPIEINKLDGSLRLFNSLRIRKYTSLNEIVLIFEKLQPQGMICEEWISKARLPNGRFDLRILVVAGEARQIVMRQSHYPMTNLHLGNRRGNLSEVEEMFGEQTVLAAMRVAERAAACFPDSLYAGVDVLVPQQGRPLICEINAFGDLLPDVWHRGDTTYEAILKASNVFCSSV